MNEGSRGPLRAGVLAPSPRVSPTSPTYLQLAHMADVPQTDVSRPSALPTAKLLQRNSLATIEQNSAEYLEAIEEEWNKKVDVEVETLVESMVDLVGLARVGGFARCIAMVFFD